MEKTQEYPQAIMDYLSTMHDKVTPNYKNDQNEFYSCSEIADDLKQLCYDNEIPAHIITYSSKEIISQSGVPNMLAEKSENRLYPQRLDGLVNTGWNHHHVCHAVNNEGILKILDPVIGKPLTHEAYQRIMFDAEIQAYQND